VVDASRSPAASDAGDSPLLALFESGCADFSVLLGDLNGGSSGAAVTLVRRRRLPAPRTCPARFPLFARPVWVHRAARIGITTARRRGASDHLPLKAELTRERL
jgi:endonuclease/exonuclease/phosphatase family metal-dependent hydrolase